MDEMTNLFSGLDVQSKKCDICGLPLSHELSRSGAIRCDDCMNDLELVNGRKHKNSHKKRKPEAQPARKPRNHAVILESDDEDGGEWIVDGGKRGVTSLGKAGGTDDENEEGEGISIGSEDSDDTEKDDDNTKATDIRYLGSKVKSKKEVITVDNSNDGNHSGTDSEVEAEIETSSEGEAELATIIASTKITHLLKILAKEAAQHKFIVFSQFTSMLDLIEPFLKRDGHRYTRYDGSMKNDLREASLSRLRNDKSCRVLLCSLKCGSLGLNLTAATRVIILEPFWNPVSQYPVQSPKPYSDDSFTS
jgi:SNF2 family DNA or RNA helicase